MANVARVNGFRPVKNIHGDEYDGKVNMYAFAAADGTACFVGDLVKLAGAADATTGVATVTRAATGDVPLAGVVVGFAPNPTNLNLGGNYRLASTLRYCYVVDDPTALFECESDQSVILADIGLNCDFIDTAGDTTTGRSKETAKTSAAAATTATLPLKIVGFVNRPDNEFPGANDKILVKINNHSFGSGTGATGV